MLLCANFNSPFMHWFLSVVQRLFLDLLCCLLSLFVVNWHSYEFSEHCCCFYALSAVSALTWRSLLWLYSAVLLCTSLSDSSLHNDLVVCIWHIVLLVFMLLSLLLIQICVWALFCLTSLCVWLFQGSCLMSLLCSIQQCHKLRNSVCQAFCHFSLLQMLSSCQFCVMFHSTLIQIVQNRWLYKIFSHCHAVSETLI